MSNAPRGRRAATVAFRAASPRILGVGLSLVLGAGSAAGCGTEGGGDPVGPGTGGGGASSSAGTAPGGSGSVAGSNPTTGGSTAGVGGSAAGTGAAAAGTGGSGGTAGGSGGAAGSASGGTAGTAGTAGSAGAGGSAPVVTMCQSASGNVPTFKRVAASDKSIAGAVGVVGNPESPDIIYVPQHFTGDVRIVQGGKLANDPLLHVNVRQDPPGREQGLLSIALSPDFKTNHLMYVFYSAVDPVGQSTIEEFQLTDATHATSKRKVYVQAHSHQWHNGGNLQFGPDKWLYFSVGDNQADCGPSCAQMAEGPYGRIRKLDVAQQDAQGTVKTFNNGLRNPWRWSFDPLTFDVVVGDVGDGGNASEKLFFAAKADSEGKNWGWAPGTLDNRNPAGTLTTLANDGGAIIGGVVYRGSNPKMAGACGLIFFGHLKGQVYTIKNDGSAKTAQAPLSGINDLGSFGVDANGEIYQTYLSGQVFRIDAN